MMKVARISVVAVLVVVALIQSTEPTSAQFGNLKKKAEDKAKKEAEKKVQPVKPTETPAAAETPSGETAPSSDAAAPAEPGKGAWLNYDFVPGTRVLFFDDFMADQVGNFPQRLEFIEGNMEVAEWNKMRWLRSSTRSKFSIPLPDTLPKKFTIEFDMYTGSGGWNSIAVVGGEPTIEQTAVFMDITNRYAGLREYNGSNIAMGKVDEGAYAQVMHGRVMADGPYVKVYVNENRVANVPKVNFIRSNSLRFEIEATDQRPLMLANFRIASSDKTIYDALAANGRVATQGILFASGSDQIRPESTPTLKEIGKMLTDHADLKILIEGHTDNVGDDASNMSLSERRAAAVASYLVANLGVDASRLQSKGFGETKPVTGNDTAEGRQNNRRVELVKL
jgi:outer membrane protein OmpA-like peptidoglycan-associated protein